MVGLRGLGRLGTAPRHRRRTGAGRRSERALQILAALTVVGVSSACGPGPNNTQLDASSGSGEATATKEGMVRLELFTDTSNLPLESGERIVVDRVVVRLADLRLLSADPHIPAGGLDLLSDAVLVDSAAPEPTRNLSFEARELLEAVQPSGTDTPAEVSDLPPSSVQDNLDLAIYVRISPPGTSQNESAGRFAREEANPSPTSVESAAGSNPGLRKGSEDFSAFIAGRLEQGETSTPFELRAKETADLVTAVFLGENSNCEFRVGLGIPLNRLISLEILGALRSRTSEPSPYQVSLGAQAKNRGAFVLVSP